MTWLKRIVLGVLSVLVIATLGLFGFVQLRWNRTWDVPTPQLKASTDPEVIARGKYLVHGPAHCSNCHVDSLASMQKADQGVDLPLIGGAEFPMGPVGKLYPANLTPDPETGIGAKTDAQLFRFLRYAVKADGTATISLMMPFQTMADEDHVAIVSYLRSLKPVRHEVPAGQWTLMGKIVRTLAPPFRPVFEPKYAEKAPPSAVTPERGEYLTRRVANCFGCHTRFDMMTFEQIGPDFGGGAEFEPMPWADPHTWTRSVNLTPHPTGMLKRIGTREAWLARFRAGRTVAGSPMHWGPFSRMDDEDLGAIWEYLHTVPPVDNPIAPTSFQKT